MEVGGKNLCDICLSNPCLPLCPNAPEPPTVFICSGCGNPIYHGEDYWELLGEQFCESCIEDSRQEATYDPY